MRLSRSTLLHHLVKIIFWLQLSIVSSMLLGAWKWTSVHQTSFAQLGWVIGQGFVIWIIFLLTLGLNITIWSSSSWTIASNSYFGCLVIILLLIIEPPSDVVSCLHHHPCCSSHVTNQTTDQHSAMNKASLTILVNNLQLASLLSKVVAILEDGILINYIIN